MDHAIKDKHDIDWQGVKIVGKEADCGKRSIREGVTIRTYLNNMDIDEGRYGQSDLYDDLLVPIS